MSKTLFTLLFVFVVATVSAQQSIKPYFGAGYGMEHRLGFRGISLSGQADLGISTHLDGIVGLSYFFSNHAPQFTAAQNQGVYYRQFTTELKFQYHTGEETGTGLLLMGGLGMRMGKTHHFESDHLLDGHLTEAVYMTEVLRGNGLVMGIGYGFKLNENLVGKIEFNHYAIGTLNDMQVLSFKLGF